MANFKTHITAAALSSGLLSAAFLSTKLISPKETILFFALGTVGGMMPDIDSDTSKPLRYTVLSISLIFSFFSMFYLGDGLSVAEMGIIWAISFFLTYFFIYYFMSNYTVHRGLIHSVPMGLIFSFATVILLFNIFKLGVEVSYFGGLFMFFGFLVHLILDETYSVDVYGARLKKSFGTALKFYDKENIFGTVFVYLMLIITLFFLPPYEKFLAFITNKMLYVRLYEALLPQGEWFSGFKDGFIKFLSSTL